jgi:hypothetical protein
MELDFRDRFSKNAQISNLRNIRPVGAELFHSDRRTDMAKLIVAFRNVANAPKNPLWHFAKSQSSEWSAVRRWKIAHNMVTTSTSEVLTGV